MRFACFPPAGALAAALVVVCVACGPAGDAPAAPDWAGTTTDSAGIVLVANPAAPLWSPDEAWTVVEELRVGGDEARPETLFGHVADVAVGADARMFVLDQQAQAVRVFGPDGASLGTLGRPGEGPGELGRFTTSLVVTGDTVGVVDWGQARLTRFTAAGGVLGSEPLPVAGGARSWWQVGPDGVLRVRSLQRYTDEDGRWQGRDALLTLRAAAAPDTFLVFEYEPADLGAPGAPNVPLIVNAPAWTALPDGGVAWLTLEDGRVRIHGADGRLRRIVTSPAWEGRAPTAADVEALRTGLGDKLEMLGGSRAALDQLPVEAPERLPGVTSLRAGPDGTLWVQRMGVPEDVHPMALNGPDPPDGWGGGAWDVLDADGRWLGTVEMPRRLRVFHITDDAVYGVVRDDLDVERLVRLGIVRGG